jgi:Hsp90 protein
MTPCPRQESRVVRVIRKQLVRRTLEMIKEIADRAPPAPAGDDKEAPAARSDYETFWEAFGRNIKMGCIEDSANKEALASLLRFSSSKSGEEVTSLDDYVSRSGRQLFHPCFCLSFCLPSVRMSVHLILVGQLVLHVCVGLSISTHAHQSVRLVQPAHVCSECLWYISATSGFNVRCLVASLPVERCPTI